MRVLALSDVHVDFEPNAQWISGISRSDYQDDILLLGGDISDSLPQMEWCLGELSSRFSKVLFVPGNHELWVVRDPPRTSSLEKFEWVRAAVRAGGACMDAFHIDGLSIYPLLGWYDYSFGAPSAELLDIWADSYACRWPNGFDPQAITRHFCAMNRTAPSGNAATTITFSHFVPRIDVMPATIPAKLQLLYPILGSTLIDQQLRSLGSTIHLYGHSHVNRTVQFDGVTYINNALGYPREKRFADKALVCVHEH